MNSIKVRLSFVKMSKPRISRSQSARRILILLKRPPTIESPLVSKRRGNLPTLYLVRGSATTSSKLKRTSRMRRKSSPLLLMELLAVPLLKTLSGKKSRKRQRLMHQKAAKHLLKERRSDLLVLMINVIICISIHFALIIPIMVNPSLTW